MTNYIESGIITNTAVNGNIWFIDDGDSLYVTTSGQLYATGIGATAITGGNNNNVRIAGQVFGDTAIRTDENSVNGYGSSSVSVLKSGIVTGDTYGVQMLGSDNSVKIAGQVFGDTAIETSPPYSTGNNIVSVLDGGIVSGGSFGVHMAGGSNTATIAGQVFGDIAIEMGRQGNDYFSLGGSIVSVLDGGIVSGDSYGVRLSGSNNTVLNDGTISGIYGISIVGNYSTIVNTGTILAVADAVNLEIPVGNIRLLNKGDISSPSYAIDCSGYGTVKVVNQGTMTGVVALGALDDIYDGRLGTVEGNVVGKGGNDRLLGGVGAETLDGGTGNDTLKGFGGDDSYWVDSLSDVVSEVGGTGEDMIFTTVSLDLAATNLRGDIENVTLAAGAGNLNAFGDGLENELTGNEAANLLDGRAGADRLTGLAGDDIYVVDNLGDVVDEAAGAGIDTVRASISFSLAASTRVLGLVENIELIGAAAVAATGNTSANLITGNIAANQLSGGGGWTRSALSPR